MKKFQKSPNCHRCMINFACESSRCKYCNLALCMPCYQFYKDINEQYKAHTFFIPGVGFAVICYNCQESQRVMHEIDCWLAIHGSDKK